MVISLWLYGAGLFGYPRSAMGNSVFDLSKVEPRERVRKRKKRKLKW